MHGFHGANLVPGNGGETGLSDAQIQQYLISQSKVGDTIRSSARPPIKALVRQAPPDLSVITPARTSAGHAVPTKYTLLRGYYRARVRRQGGTTLPIEHFDATRVLQERARVKPGSNSPKNARIQKAGRATDARGNDLDSAGAHRARDTDGDARRRRNYLLFNRRIRTAAALR